MPKRRAKINQPQPPPTKLTKAKQFLNAAAAQFKLFTANNDATWLFVFVPFLVATLVLFKIHFAHRKLGTLHVSLGREPAANAIFPFASDPTRLEYTSVLQEVASSGFTWAEGPLWTLRPGHEGNTAFGRLLFSAVHTNSILKVEYDGMSRYARHSGCRDNDMTRQGLVPCGQLREPGSNGLAYNPVDGHVYACEHGSRSVTRLEPNGTHTTIVRLHQGKRFNSPNDLIFTSQGDIFFTDPDYGLQQIGKDGDGHDSDEKEMKYQGLYFIGRANDNDKDDQLDAMGTQPGIDYDSDAVLLIDALERPNGIALSPDESILYVVNSNPPQVLKYNIVSMPQLRSCVKEPGTSGASGGESPGTSGGGGGGGGGGARKRKEKRRKKSLDDLLKEEEAEEAEEKKAMEAEKVAKGNRFLVENDDIEANDGGLGETGERKETANKKRQERKPVLSKGELFFDFQPLVEQCHAAIGGFNGPDGIKVDKDGNVYVAGACGVHVIGADGKLTASLVVNKKVTNVAWGGDERLYVTGEGAVMRVDVAHGIVPMFPAKMTGLSDAVEGESVGWL